MRLLARFALGIALAGGVTSTAHAESSGAEPKREAKPAATKKKLKAPAYRLIRILPETNQALLLDKKRGKHVVVDVGESVGGFEVTEIDEDSVVLARPGESREYVLVAGEAPAARLADPYPIPDPAPTAPASPLLDPYADVLDPYGSEGTHEVQAPEGQRASEEPPPPPPVRETVQPEPSPEPPPPPPPPTSFTVKRGDLDDALSDFGAIEKAVDMALVDGAVELRRVEASSFFHRMGLRAGDRVLKVHGKVIRSLDDAAAVYARLAKAKKFTVEIERGGVALTLSYKITK
jgi:hypothetical protein